MQLSSFNSQLVYDPANVRFPENPIQTVLTAFRSTINSYPHRRKINSEVLVHEADAVNLEVQIGRVLIHGQLSSV